MKTKVIITLLIALFLTGLLGTAFAQSADEAIKLYKQGQEAQKYGGYQEALSYFERALSYCEDSLKIRFS